MKPENLLLTSDGKLKLIDFGNATVCLDRKTRQQKNNTKIVGTPPYMAPEIFAETGYKGFQVDVWAAGIILVAMLAGEVSLNKTFLVHVFTESVIPFFYP